MRILCALMDDHVGGPQVRTVTVGKEIKKYDIDYVLTFPDNSGPLKGYAEINQLHTCPIMLIGPKNFRSLHDILHNIVWVLSVPISTLYVANIIEKENIDVVHANGLFCIQAPIAAFIKGRKIVWHLMGTMYPPIVVRLMRRLIYKISDKIVVISPKVREYYFEKSYLKSEKIETIYECIDSSRFTTSRLSAQKLGMLKEKIDNSDESTILVSVGNVNPVKGYEYLIRCMNLLKGKKIPVKLIIAGEITCQQEGYYQRLMDLSKSLDVSNDIQFLGRVECIPELLSLADIFVLSSISEGTPIAVLEASAMGLPVVATDVGGVSDVIIKNGSGLLVPSKNPECMAEALEQIISDSKLKERLGTNGRAHVAENFSLDCCVEKHVNLYGAVDSMPAHDTTPLQSSPKPS